MGQSPVQIVNAKASPEAKASSGGKADAEKHPETPFNAVLLATKALLNGQEAKAHQQQSGEAAQKEEKAPVAGKKTGEDKHLQAGEQLEGAKKKGEAAPTVDSSTQQSPVIVVGQGEKPADVARAGEFSLEENLAKVARADKSLRGTKTQRSDKEITLIAREGKGHALEHQSAQEQSATKKQDRAKSVPPKPALQGEATPGDISSKSQEADTDLKGTRAKQRQEAAFEGSKGKAPLSRKANNKELDSSLVTGEQAKTSEKEGEKKQVRKQRDSRGATERVQKKSLQEGETTPSHRAKSAKDEKGQKTAPGQHSQSAAPATQTQHGPRQQAKQQAGGLTQETSTARPATPPPPPLTSSDGGTSSDADTNQEGSPFSSKSGQTRPAQSQLGAAKSEGGAFSQRLRQHWTQTLRAKTLRSSETKGGWKQLKLQLPGEDGTMQLMAKQGEQQMAVSVGFSDPALRSLMQGQVEQMRQTLQAEYDAPVDFSLMDGDEEQNEPGRERSAASRPGGQAAPNSDGSAEDAGANDLSPLQRRTLSNREWIG